MYEYVNEVFINHSAKRCLFTDKGDTIVIVLIMHNLPQNLHQTLVFNRSNAKDLFEISLDRAFKLSIALYKIHQKYIHGSITDKNILFEDYFTPVITNFTYF